MKKDSLPEAEWLNTSKKTCVFVIGAKVEVEVEAEAKSLEQFATIQNVHFSPAKLFFFKLTRIQSILFEFFSSIFQTMNQ